MKHMKQWKKMVLLVASMVILVIVLIVSNKLNPGNGDKDPTPTPGIEPVFQIDQQEVLQIRIDHQGETLEFSPINVPSEEDEDRLEWIMTKPEGVAYNELALLSKIKDYTTIYANAFISDEVTNLDEYGLDDPVAVLTIFLKSGSTERVLYGDKTVVGNARYVMLEGSNRICTAFVSYTNSVTITLLDLYSNEVFGARTTVDLKELEFRRKRDGLVIKAKSNEDGSEETEMQSTWNVTSPMAAEGDSDGFYKFLNELLSISPVSFVEIGPADLARYRLDNPDYEYLLDFGTQQIRCKISAGAGEGNYYGYTDYSDAVFVIMPHLINFIDKPIYELINPFAHPVAIWDVKKIEIRINSMDIVCDIEDDENKEKPSVFLVNGQDASVVDSNGNSYFRGLYQSIISILVVGTDPEAQPEYKDPEITIQFRMKKSSQDTRIDFVRRDDIYYYIFKDGEFQGYYVNRDSFYSDREPRIGILPAYDALISAMENQVNGVYDD